MKERTKKCKRQTNREGEGEKREEGEVRLIHDTKVIESSSFLERERASVDNGGQAAEPIHRRFAGSCCRGAARLMMSLITIVRT